MVVTAHRSSPRLIILDRDGVINKDRPQGCRSSEDFIMLPRVVDALGLINEYDIPVTIATNQALVGRGELSLRGLESIHEHMRHVFRKEGVEMGKIYFCTDTTVEPHYRRKPAPGMLLEAMRDYGVSPLETIFIGDDLRDLQAAAQAGCVGVLVKTGKGRQTLANLPAALKNTPIYEDLYDAVENLLTR